MIYKQWLFILVTIGIFAVASFIYIAAEERVSEKQNPQAQESLTALYTKKVIGKDRVPMVLIPAGEFQMGDQFNEGLVDERPVHAVYLDAFYIDIYEVTNAQYAKFLNEYGKTTTDQTDQTGNELLDINGSLIEKIEDIYKPKAGYENHPVIAVSWYGALAYAQFYGKRLPTEAEWEKAARGGLVKKRYPWGDEIDLSKANYNADGFRGSSAGDALVYLKKVNSYAPNGYGLYNMAGNVWEWCADWYDETYYSHSARKNPAGTDIGTRRVLRGGSWFLNSYNLCVAYRNSNHPSSMGDNVGFRCVQNTAP